MSAAFSAVLLAGGKSSRMGCDKAFIEIEGVPLWQRQVETLKKLTPNELFISGPAQAEWNACGYEILPDAREDAGPLAGLVASLRRCQRPLLLVLAVDLPNMRAAYLQRLLDHCSDTGVVPKTGNRFEPLAAVYPITSLAIAETLLSQRTFALQRFVEACLAQKLIETIAVAPADESFFLNANRRRDLAQISR